MEELTNYHQHYTEERKKGENIYIHAFDTKVCSEQRALVLRTPPPQAQKTKKKITENTTRTFDKERTRALLSHEDIRHRLSWMSRECLPYSASVRLPWPRRGFLMPTPVILLLLFHFFLCVCLLSSSLFFLFLLYLLIYPVLYGRVH